ncbi:tyrosine-type recombinase/integrase [Vagococcus sp. BWB3-3]|uniref:Tyrosine-type recombinase/integrase n=1 Tax=Vagococcus allomyrinae TaxID=2794353 RepID=A0A940PAH9_9ENTE|nr:tyrosine-type recombinase/integrase [Vagococcus allomyrinae]MBP1040967.1 tyrosine-type recombinase/integrase [Vagococcus allomyrinae]
MIGASPNTISSYRDMFKMMFLFFEQVYQLSPEKITMSHFTRETIQHFLIWLVESRGNSLSTQNTRLASLKSFIDYLMKVEPDFLYELKEIRAIKAKSYGKPPMDFLSIDALTCLLGTPDTSTRKGLREATLLSLMYDTGCRVQELIDLTINDIRLSNTSTIQLKGKGNKQRIIPIMTPMSELLQSYLQQFNCTNHLFLNHSNLKLSRKGVTYLLQKNVDKAKTLTGIEFPNSVSPHVLRHSKAMHLLRAGVNLIYIRDFLGHVDIKTTEIYARADSEMKRKALEQSMNLVPSASQPIWQEDQSLLAWLNSL